MTDRLEKKLKKALEAHRSGRTLEAERLYRSVLTESPEHDRALFGLGCLALDSGQVAQSEQLLERAIESASRHAAYHLSLARAKRRLGKQLDAALSLANALDCDPLVPLDPGMLETLIDLSTLLRRSGRQGDAVSIARHAIGLSADSARAHAALAAALADAWHLDEAVATGERAVALDGELSEAHHRLGTALFGRGELERALASFRRALELDPEEHVAHSNFILGMTYVSGYDDRAIADEARAWARRHAEPFGAAVEPHANELGAERRLRVGYVSADFRAHPAAHFMLPIVEHRDRERFEVVCYSSVRQPDVATARIRALCDAFHDVATLSDQALAERIRADRIDILVDLSLHSGDHRLKAFARRPAPVQITYLAYLGTSGLSAMDYRLTAPLLDGAMPDDAAHYVEAPLRLPETYWCYDPLEFLAPGALPVPQPTPALARGRVTFGSQNSFHKLGRETLVLWSRVLRAAPASRLVLHAPPEATSRVRELFEGEGVDGERLTLLPRRARAEYLRTFSDIDLCLDSIPFNGATTTLDGLFMGTPTLTLVGRTAPGRAGLSIFTLLGSPELVATSDDEFVKRALELTSDLERLGLLRASLRERLLHSPLMDGPRFVRHLEAAYRGAWRAFCDKYRAA